MAVDIGSTIQELIQAINEEKGTQYYIKNIGGTCGNSLQGSGSSQYVITKLKNQRKPQISDFVIKIYSTPNDYGQNVIVEQITDIVGSVTVADDDETVTIGSCTHIERYFANGKNGEDGITDIADQYVRIWDLDTGIYRLTYEGTKYIYYYGATNTSMTAKSLVDKPIIYVNYYNSGSSEYKTWVSITAHEGTSGRIISGYTTATYGSVNYKTISSLLTTGQVRNDLTYDTSNQSYVLSAYQGYVLKQEIDKINQKIGDSANKIPYFTISTNHPLSETITIQNLYDNLADSFDGVPPVVLLNVTGYFVKFGVLDINSRGDVKLITFMDLGSQSIYSGEVSSTDKISVIFENLKPLATTDVATTTTDGLMSADDKKKLMYHIDDDSVETTYLDIGIDDWTAGVQMKQLNGSNVVDIYGDEVTVNGKTIATTATATTESDGLMSADDKKLVDSYFNYSMEDTSYIEMYANDGDSGLNLHGLDVELYGDNVQISGGDSINLVSILGRIDITADSYVYTSADAGVVISAPTIDMYGDVTINDEPVASRIYGVDSEITIYPRSVGSYFRVTACVSDADEIDIGGLCYALVSGVSNYISIEGHVYDSIDSGVYRVAIAVTIVYDDGTEPEMHHFTTNCDDTGLGIYDTSVSQSTFYTGIICP